MIAKDVLIAFKKGKKKGFDRIYEAYAPGMFAIVLRYVRDPDSAKDVLQDSFIKIYNHRESYNIDLPIGAWIKTITIKTALNHIKKESRFVRTEEVFFEAEVESSELEIGTDMQVELKRALNQLPLGYRTVFSLFAIDNLTHKEIAEYLEIAEGTSKSQYSKARKMLQEILTTDKIAS